jgi:hypothetical protein
MPCSGLPFCFITGAGCERSVEAVELLRLEHARTAQRCVRRGPYEQYSPVAVAGVRPRPNLLG